MAERKTGEVLQLQMRQNVEELNDFLKDLNSWEADIKKKDADLKSARTEEKQKIPPVRNQVRKKKTKKKSKETIKDERKKEKKISSYDYRSWDKFDVDKVLQEMDDAEDLRTRSSSGEESEDELSEEEYFEEQRRIQQAVHEKDKGNKFFKDGQYEDAVESYTRGIELDPTNAILPANRAMALIKLERLGAAEKDCSLSLSLNPSYTKAFARRGAARIGLGKLEEALKDYEEILKFQPGNAEAKEQISKIKKLQGVEEEPPKSKDPPPKRTKSKKPMRRIPIQEIGSDSEDESKAPSKQPSQSRTVMEEAPPVENKVESHVPIIEELSTPSPSSEGTSSTQETTAERRINNTMATGTSGARKEGTPGNSTGVKLPQPQELVTPKSSVQFQKDWKRLCNNQELRFEYLKKIPPESYPKIVSQSVDSDVVTDFLKVLRDCYIPNQCSVYKEMKHLSEIKRFSMTVMFFSSADKKVVLDLIEYLRNTASAQDSGVTEKEIASLAKKYGVD